MIAAALLMAGSAFAQQALWGGTSVESPVVNEDGTVTFRYQAPKAVKVTVSGDFLPTQKMTFKMGDQEMTYDAPGVGELKEGKNGVWEYTTDFKVAPDMYTYTFNVDGNTVIDNNNVWVNRDIASLTSAFIVPGGRADLYTIQDVPHGTVSKVWYESATAGFDRRISVYTPAGYEQNKKLKYPVLYVLHGIGGDEDAWIEQGLYQQVYESYWDAATMRSLGEITDRKIADLKREHQKQMDNLRRRRDEQIQRIRKKAELEKEHYRKRAQLKEAEAREKYRKSLDEYREARERTELRRKSYKVYSELLTLLKDPTKKMHILPELQMLSRHS